MREPTERQEEVLEWIRNHIRRCGVPPSRSEIAHGLGLSEASSVVSHLKALARHGRIEILPKKNGSPKTGVGGLRSNRWAPPRVATGRAACQRAARVLRSRFGPAG